MAIVREILHKRVPQYEVWAFGSRTKWTAKEFSDLDLAIITDKPLSLDVSASLSDDFSESDLPWKVDIVDWAGTSVSFKKIIEQDKVVVQEIKKGANLANDWQETTIEKFCPFIYDKALHQDNAHALTISVPPIGEQQAIAQILGTLDDKIELNRQMNETLEAMARALFKAWFVDFEPVRAKMADRWRRGESLPGLPAHLYDLFPDRLVESELGLVPNEWAIQRLENFIELVHGKALKPTDRIPGEIQIYGSGGITGYHNIGLSNGPSIIVGRKGTVGGLYWEDMPFYPIDTVFFVRTKIPMTYCFYLLQTLGLDNMNTAAAVPGLNRNNVYRLTVAYPTEQLLEAFDGKAKPIREKLFENRKETATLIKIRDILLPKLISGELRIKDAERIVGVAG